jgi:hypothetical protein
MTIEKAHHQMGLFLIVFFSGGNQKKHIKTLYAEILVVETDSQKP